MRLNISIEVTPEDVLAMVRGFQDVDEARVMKDNLECAQKHIDRLKKDQVMISEKADIFSRETARLGHALGSCKAENKPLKFCRNGGLSRRKLPLKMRVLNSNESLKKENVS